MNNFYKFIITVLIAFSLSLSSIMCCCLKEALASTAEHSASCHVPTDKANSGHKSQKMHDCQCLKVLSDKTNNDFAIQYFSSPYYEGYIKDGKTLGRFFNYELLNYASLCGDRPPPILSAASIPIYLKISILRI